MAIIFTPNFLKKMLTEHYNNPYDRFCLFVFIFKSLVYLKINKSL